MDANRLVMDTQRKYQRQGKMVSIKEVCLRIMDNAKVSKQTKQEINNILKKVRSGSNGM